MSFTDVLMGKRPGSFQINGGTYELRFQPDGGTEEQVGYAYQHNNMLYMIVDNSKVTMPVTMGLSDILAFKKISTSFAPGSSNFYSTYKDSYGSNTGYFKEVSDPETWDGS